MSLHSLDSQNLDDQLVHHHEPPFDNTSVSAVLSRIGLSPLAVDAFMGVHLSTPPLLAMPSFLRYLRDLVGDSRTAPDPSYILRLHALRFALTPGHLGQRPR